MIRLGVLGAGNHSRVHGAALQIIKAQSPARLDLTAVCDVEADKARDYQARFGFRAFYTDIDEMLDKETLHGLLLITPVPLTKSIVLSILPRKIPLLIEKPTGENSVEAQKLQACATEYGTVHMVSYNRRFSPALIKAREWIAADPKKRKPVFILARMLRHRRCEPEFVTGTGVHLVDTVLSVLGRPERVSAKRTQSAGGCCLHYYALISFGDGVMAQCVIAPDAGVTEESYEIHGPEYCINVDTCACHVRITREDNRIFEWRAPADAAPSFIDGTLSEMNAFLDLIEAEPVTVPSLEDAVLDLITAEAIAKGSETNIENL